MNEPMLGQTSRSAVESYLRAKREKGQLTDEEIARLDAIGFKWEKRKKKTIEEKVDLYVHYRESGKRWRCNETGERFRSLDDAFRKYGKEGDTLDVLRSRVKKGHTWHGMTITRCQTERPITSNEHSNLTISLKRHLGREPRRAGIRACKARLLWVPRLQGRPLYDGLRLHGLGDRYEQHLL